MQFFAPDIMAEIRDLSFPIVVVGFVLGAVVWATGWWGHRFWIVLCATVFAGIWGLSSAPADRVQTLSAGLLLAVAAGLLALALIRVVAFGAGGLAALMAVRAFAPPSWDDPLLCMLAGGLVGLLLFRVWTMALTSFGGGLLLGYFGLSLAQHLDKVDAVAYTEGHGLLLNWVCGAVALAGMVLQFLLDRWRIKKEREREEEEYDKSKRYQRYNESQWWWNRSRRPYRRAG